MTVRDVTLNGRDVVNGRESVSADYSLRLATFDVLGEELATQAVRGGLRRSSHYFRTIGLLLPSNLRLASPRGSAFANARVPVGTDWRGGVGWNWRGHGVGSG